MPDREHTDLLPEDPSPAAIESTIIETVQARFPEWEPSENHLDVWLIRGIALRISEMLYVAIDVADRIYARFGSMLGYPRIEAQPATALTTWTMVDDAGYYVPAGTQIAIPRTGSERIAFETAADLTVPTTETSGLVSVIASEPGAAGSGLTAAPQLIDALSFVDSIAVAGSTSGGVDAESVTDYLIRLTELLTTLAPRPILPRDFEVLARQEVGVARAVAIDGLDPSDDSPNNERMVAVAVMDDNGDPLPDGSAPAQPGTKLYVQQALDARREVNFIVHVIDHDYTAIDVTTEVTVLPGFSQAGVDERVEAALIEYLKPINSGRLDSHRWRNIDKVRYLEIAEVINRVDGVDHIDVLTINEDGESADTVDVDLDGNAPVTEPGSITVGS